MNYRNVPPVSQRLIAMGLRRMTCPRCKRDDVEVGGPIDGDWIILNHSPQPGGVVGCRGIGERIPVTAKEKASP